MAFERLVTPFVSPAARNVLPALRGNLESFRRAPTLDPFDWTIPEERPFDTIVSDGEYDRAGRLRVFARVASIWTIKRLVPRSRPHANATQFVLSGKTSTMVRVIRVKGRRRSKNPQLGQVAMWRLEIGNEDAPGCHFHVQILGETPQPPFPKTLPIPRLPSLAVTPAASIELILAELFQQRWRDHMRNESPELQSWRSIQSRRLTNLLDWQRTQLGMLGSPWSNLKSAKPHSGLFALASSEARRS